MMEFLLYIAPFFEPDWVRVGTLLVSVAKRCSPLSDNSKSMAVILLTEVEMVSVPPAYIRNSPFIAVDAELVPSVAVMVIPRELNEVFWKLLIFRVMVSADRVAAITMVARKM